jgi:hypothetical protein
MQEEGGRDLFPLIKMSKKEKILCQNLYKIEATTGDLSDRREKFLRKRGEDQPTPLKGVFQIAFKILGIPGRKSNGCGRELLDPGESGGILSGA